MKDGYTVNNDNINAFSRDWNQREQLSSLSTQITQLLITIEQFRSPLLQGVTHRDSVQ